MSKKLATTVGGRTVEVDTSAEECGEFGVCSGDRIKFFNHDQGTVVGVSFENEDSVDKVLWIAFDKDGGEKVRFVYENQKGDIVLATTK